MKILTIILLFFLIFSVGAATFNYLEGDVFIIDNGEWYEVFIGDEVERSDIIKLGPSSLVEISTGSNTLILSKPGVYKLKDLLVERAIANNVFKKFMARDVQVQSAAMGVRGSATETDSMDWVEGEDEVIEEVIELIRLKEYEEAIYLLHDEIEFADDINNYNYYLGYNYYMTDSLSKALTHLNEVERYIEEDYYSDYVIMMGSLLINNLEYNMALFLFDSYLKSDSFSIEAQTISLLTAATYQAMGDTRKAKERLEITIKMGDTEIGKNAQDMLDIIR